MIPLTKRQAVVLDYIRESLHNRGYPPTMREIGDRCGISSTNAVADKLRALEAKGYITRESLQARGIRLTEAANDVRRETAMLEVKFAKLRESAERPTYATDGSVGLDLYAAEGALVSDGGTVLVDTGIALELPQGYEAQIRGRSGLAKHGVMVATGTVDSDYRGPVKVCMWAVNGSWQVKVGDRIAQMVIAPVPRVELICVAARAISTTERGDGGFGSSGR